MMMKDMMMVVVTVMIMTTLWKCALNKNDQDDEDMVFPLIC